MHPPRFNRNHRLSDWPDCCLELRCQCGRITYPSTKLLRQRFGDVAFGDLVPRLRCEKCSRSFSPVYLLAGHHRTACGGPPPDWSLELVAQGNVAMS